MISERITAGAGTGGGCPSWFSRAVAAQAVEDSTNWDAVKMKISRPRIGPNAAPAGVSVTYRSITEFSERYAGQNEQDFQDFVKAVGSGRIEALEGV